jgi:hypothetical protein
VRELIFQLVAENPTWGAPRIHYYHEDWTHLGLQKRTPGGRIRSLVSRPIVSQRRLDGLHHRYVRAA